MRNVAGWGAAGCAAVVRPPISREADRRLTGTKQLWLFNPANLDEQQSAARGFRAFENFRTRILFYRGKLELLPIKTTHRNT